MKSILLSFIALITIILTASLFMVFSGTFNVSSNWEDPPLLEWLLVETRENSVKKRAKSIKEQGRITGEQSQLNNGFRSYREMCANCHSSPGQAKSPIAVGLNPTPPDLTKKRDHEMSASELFWVIKYGIRMTGMPAWGQTHKDGEIWDIVAFLKILPDLKSTDYLDLDRTLEAGHGHSGVSDHHINTTKQAHEGHNSHHDAVPHSH